MIVTVSGEYRMSRDKGGGTGISHMFLARVEAVHADEAWMDEKGRFDLNKALPVAYSHGEYYGLGRKLGTFGFSVRRKTAASAKGKKTD